MTPTVTAKRRKLRDELRAAALRFERELPAWMRLWRRDIARAARREETR